MYIFATISIIVGITVVVLSKRMIKYYSDRPANGEVGKLMLLDKKILLQLDKLKHCQACPITHKP